jgi:hypothetical protein
MCMKCGTRTGGRGGCTCRKDRTNKCIESGKHFDYMIDNEPLIEQGVLFWGNVLECDLLPLPSGAKEYIIGTKLQQFPKNVKR